MYYGQCENDEFELLTMTAVCFVLFSFSFSYLTLSLHVRSFILFRHFPARGRLKSKRKKPAF